MRYLVKKPSLSPSVIGKSRSSTSCASRFARRAQSARRGAPRWGRQQIQDPRRRTAGRSSRVSPGRLPPPAARPLTTAARETGARGRGLYPAGLTAVHVAADGQTEGLRDQKRSRVLPHIEFGMRAVERERQWGGLPLDDRQFDALGGMRGGFRDRVVVPGRHAGDDEAPSAVAPRRADLAPVLVVALRKERNPGAPNRRLRVREHGLAFDAADGSSLRQRVGDGDPYAGHRHQQAGMPRSQERRGTEQRAEASAGRVNAPPRRGVHSETAAAPPPDRSSSVVAAAIARMRRPSTQTTR